MVLLLIPAIALAAAALGGVIEALKALDSGLRSDVVRHTFWGVCCASGAVALSLIAAGRPA
ncbi:hypothetical protein ACLBX9_09790 [Methylobacterium sp. A49B]